MRYIIQLWTLFFTFALKMNLIIDLGNTYHKLAICHHDEIIEVRRFSELKASDLDSLAKEYTLQKAIISSVIKNDVEIKCWLAKNIPFVEMSVNLKFPFKLLYQSKDTLGTDRIAASVGARKMFPTGNILVIQAGSCVTFDFVDKDNLYHGGSISPGIMMRLKSMNYYTGKLPEIDFEEISSFIGNSTKESMLSGATCGIASEIDGMIERYKELFEDLTVIITGGAIKYFDKWLKNSNFANPNLVIEGLNTILNIND